MDINRYSEIKPKGTVKLAAVNGMLIIRQQRFCPETGVALEPSVQTVPVKQALEQADQQIVALENALKSLREFKADIETADEASKA